MKKYGSFNVKCWGVSIRDFPYLYIFRKVGSSEGRRRMVVKTAKEWVKGSSSLKIDIAVLIKLMQILWKVMIFN